MKVLSTRIANFQEMKGKYPEVIYKYRTWADDFHKKALTDRQLYYSPPSKFIDPNDCKGAIRYDLLSSSEKIKFIEHKLRENIPGKTRNYYRSESRQLFKTSPLRNNSEIVKQNEETYQEFDKRIGVLSLTPNHKNMKMWLDYANDHQGFCIGYHSEYLFQQLGGGCKVFYDKELPTIYPYPKHTYEEQYILQIYFKENKWAFEDEYRTQTFKVSPLTGADRMISVNPNAFKEIILGAKLSNETKTEIVNSIPEPIRHVPILEAEIINGQIEIKNYR